MIEKYATGSGVNGACDDKSGASFAAVMKCQILKQ